MSRSEADIGPMNDAITVERYKLLVELAASCLTDADRCAEIERFHPACMMAGAGAEAAILVQVCVLAPEVRSAELWRDTPKAPFDWAFEHLIHIAVAMNWLPATRVSVPNEEPVDKLTGEVGDAVRFVQTHETSPHIPESMSMTCRG